MDKVEREAAVMVFVCLFLITPEVVKRELLEDSLYAPVGKLEG